MLKAGLHAFRIGVTILALVTASAVHAGQIHKVTKGDTLWTIARHYKVSIYDIKRANGISSNKPLKIGKGLSIPTKGGSNHRHTASRKTVSRFEPRMAHQMAAQATGSHSTSVVRTALAYRGSRYVRGGTGRNGFDCSGFTRYVYAKHGVSLPHQSGAQSHCGKSVSKSQLKPGDLVFFGCGRRSISHVGMYVGNSRFVHAATPGRGVIVSSLNEAYYSRRYKGARRVASRK